MIIQCEKCRTRFRLDDSRVTEAGVRVRCSRCSHTFVVRRDVSEEETDFDSILDGLGEGGVPAEDEQGAATAGEEQSAAELDAAMPGEEKEEAGVPEEDFVEKGQAEDEPVAEQAADAPAQPEESFADFLKNNTGLLQFQGSAAPETSVDEPEPEQDDLMPFQFPETAAEAADSSEPEQELDNPAQQEVETAGSGELADSEPERSRSLREEIWPVADSKDEMDDSNDELPPLSIASRRKANPLVPIIGGVCLLLLLAGAALYLLTGDNGSSGSLVPDSVKQLVSLGTTPGSAVEIHSLEGKFLANKNAWELFVMQGEAVNMSGKPLSALQVQGTIYGASGEVLVQRTVYCGNVFSPEELVFRSYSGMDGAMGRMLGSGLANLEVLPGKSVPFMIVFKGVPAGARDFAAKVQLPADGGR